LNELGHGDCIVTVRAVTLLYDNVTSVTR